MKKFDGKNKKFFKKSDNASMSEENKVFTPLAPLEKLRKKSKTKEMWLKIKEEHIPVGTLWEKELNSLANSSYKAKNTPNKRFRAGMKRKSPNKTGRHGVINNASEPVNVPEPVNESISYDIYKEDTFICESYESVEKLIEECGIVIPRSTSGDYSSESSHRQQASVPYDENTVLPSIQEQTSSENMTEPDINHFQESAAPAPFTVAEVSENQKSALSAYSDEVSMTAPEVGKIAEELEETPASFATDAKQEHLKGQEQQKSQPVDNNTLSQKTAPSNKADAVVHESREQPESVLNSAIPEVHHSVSYSEAEKLETEDAEPLVSSADSQSISSKSVDNMLQKQAVSEAGGIMHDMNQIPQQSAPQISSETVAQNVLHEQQQEQVPSAVQDAQTESTESKAEPQTPEAVLESPEVQEPASPDFSEVNQEERTQEESESLVASEFTPEPQTQEEPVSPAHSEAIDEVRCGEDLQMQPETLDLQDEILSDVSDGQINENEEHYMAESPEEPAVSGEVSQPEDIEKIEVVEVRPDSVIDVDADVSCDAGILEDCPPEPVKPLIVDSGSAEGLESISDADKEEFIPLNKIDNNQESMSYEKSASAGIHSFSDCSDQSRSKRIIAYDAKSSEQDDYSYEPGIELVKYDFNVNEDFSRFTVDNPPKWDIIKHTEATRKHGKSVISQFQESIKLKKVFNMSNLMNLSTQLAGLCEHDSDQFVSLARIKDTEEYYAGHPFNVAVYSIVLGYILGFGTKKLIRLGLSGLLHDIGETSLPDRMVNKSAKYTSSEHNAMQRHPSLGYEMLKEKCNLPQDVLMGILQHHERLDGTGYPSGFNDKYIHPFGKIISVAEVYDAITTGRHGRQSTPTDAIKILYGMSGRHYEKTVVRALIVALSMYPVGSLLKLSEGQLAVSIKKNSDLTKPGVIVISDKFEQLVEPYVVDLSKDTAGRLVTKPLIASKYRINTEQYIQDALSINGFLDIL